MSSSPQPSELRLNRLLSIYVPLALSWIMMAAEMPICTGFVNSLPDHRVQVASLLALMSIALFVESPVIDLLATSTTLASSRQSFAAIRKFSVWLMVWCGLFHFLLAVTPLYDVVFRQILALPDEVVKATRLPLLILVPWSPAIGWRRHVQGLLIRNGLTRVIGIGTLVRIVTILAVNGIGFAIHTLPGAVVASIALTCSVVVEALVIHFAGKKAMRSHTFDEVGEHLGMKALVAFHFPLTISTMVMLSAMPMVSRSLAAVPNPILAMNAWQVSTTLAFLLRTMTFALPEVVIANWKPGPESKLLAKFCMSIGVLLSLLMLVMSATGLDKAFFSHVTHADAGVVETAHQAFLWCSLLPLFTAATSFVKGVLTRLKVTVARVSATLASIIVLASMLTLGVANHWQGVIVASTSLTLSQVAELIVLSFLLWHKSKNPELVHRKSSG